MRQCLALDLKDDPELIAEYEAYHRKVWPEILESIRAQGIRSMEIYRTGNRLFMITETDETAAPHLGSGGDDMHPKVLEWEELMWKFQYPLPWAKEGEKWVPMDRIFSLNEQE